VYAVKQAPESHSNQHLKLTAAHVAVACEVLLAGAGVVAGRVGAGGVGVARGQLAGALVDVYGEGGGESRGGGAMKRQGEGGGGASGGASGGAGSGAGGGWTTLHAAAQPVAPGGATAGPRAPPCRRGALTLASRRRPGDGLPAGLAGAVEAAVSVVALRLRVACVPLGALVDVWRWQGGAAPPGAALALPAPARAWQSERHARAGAVPPPFTKLYWLH
jgi:hypothetical protein